LHLKSKFGISRNYFKNTGISIVVMSKEILPSFLSMMKEMQKMLSKIVKEKSFAVLE
jgi:hypothetical protein